MNTYEIDEAVKRYADHPTLGPATRTLANLEDWANQNSDGWHMWPKPARAAAKLMALIEGDDHPEGKTGARFDEERRDITPEKLRAALRPIKSFRTRQSSPLSKKPASFKICETSEHVKAQDALEEYNRKRAHLELAQKIADEYGVSFTPQGEVGP